MVSFLIIGCENIITNESNNVEYYDPEDWVELYNPTNESIEIGLWEFKDENNVFKFPEGVILKSGQYLVLCRDTIPFKSNFPHINNIIGDLNFGLSGSGEQIILYNSENELIDELEYDDTVPWPKEPDGNGPTLELIHPSLDNNLGSNWAASEMNGGTPGKVNSVYVVDSLNEQSSGIVINEINYNSADE